MTKPTKWVCAKRRLRSAWASAQSDQSSLYAQWVAKGPRFLHADSEGSDHTVFFFFMSRLKYGISICISEKHSDWSVPEKQWSCKILRRTKSPCTCPELHGQSKALGQDLFVLIFGQVLTEDAKYMLYALAESEWIVSSDSLGCLGAKGPTERRKPKVGKKAMIRNRYNRIPHPSLNTKRERDTYN